MLHKSWDFDLRLWQRFEKQLLVKEKAFFLFSRSLCFPLNLLPFHCRQKTGTRGRFVSSAYLRDKTPVNLDVLWTSRRFHSSLSLNMVPPTHIPTLTHPPHGADPVQPKKRAGHRGKGADWHRYSVLRVLRVTFLSGVAAHQAEIMRPRFMIINSCDDKPMLSLVPLIVFPENLQSSFFLSLNVFRLNQRIKNNNNQWLLWGWSQTFNRASSRQVESWQTGGRTGWQYVRMRVGNICCVYGTLVSYRFDSHMHFSHH